MAKTKQELVEVQLSSDGESNLYEGLDGEQGVFVASYRYLVLPDDTEVTVRVTFPSKAELRIVAKVAWRKEGEDVDWPGVGLEFNSLTSKEETVINRFKETRSPLFY